MYTIKQAAARSGVGVPLIRAWERRYSVVSPLRTDAGYRLYDDRMVAILRAMRALTAGGWAASQAARAIEAGEVSVEILASQPLVPAVGRRNTNELPVSVDPIQAFVRGSSGYDVRALETALDEMFSRGSFETIVDDLLLRPQ